MASGADVGACSPCGDWLSMLALRLNKVARRRQTFARLQLGVCELKHAFELRFADGLNRQPGVFEQWHFRQRFVALDLFQSYGLCEALRGHEIDARPIAFFGG